MFGCEQTKLEVTANYWYKIFYRRSRRTQRKIFAGQSVSFKQRLCALLLKY